MTNPVNAPPRHSFYEIFSGPRPHVERGAEFHLAELKSESSHPVAAAPGPTVDTSWFRPSAPVSLEALERALERAGLNLARFTFEQIEAEGDFPGRPDLSYTTRQIVIRGPNGAGMFDRDLTLRTPWVTAVELQTYGIA
jgi:hypothetical protein